MTANLKTRQRSQEQKGYVLVEDYMLIADWIQHMTYNLKEEEFHFFSLLACKKKNI